jgi:hypothetical protein
MAKSADCAAAVPSLPRRPKNFKRYYVMHAYTFRLFVSHYNEIKRMT